MNASSVGTVQEQWRDRAGTVPARPDDRGFRIGGHRSGQGSATAINNG